MAEDTDNAQKPKVILNKQKKPENPGADKSAQVNTKAPVERKKVVVIKKKTAQTPPAKPVQSSEDLSVSNTPKRTVHVIPVHRDSAADSSKPETPSVDVTSPRREVKSIELSPPRPNIKVGNLAGRGGGRNQSRPSGGQGYYQQRGNPSGSTYGRTRDGFSGSQAREEARDQLQSNDGYHRNRPPAGYGSGNRSSGGYTGPRTGGGPGPRTGGNYQGRSNRPGGGYNGPRPSGPGRGPGTGYQGGPNRGSGYGGGRSGAPGRGGTSMSLPMDSRNSGPSKKNFKGKKTVYSRKKREDNFEEKLLQQKKKAQDKANAIPKDIEIMETISVSELARKMNLKASELIGKLMAMGMMVTMNQSIDADTATILASEYDCTVHIVSLYDETVIASDSGGDAKSLHRPPVVTIMGHVDHGKTKTLDAIRSTNVVAGEFGGITQHIGAYTVETKKGRITFLDTPGHEAFTMMRARGAAITDIVVLVVAADDGVMPQTIEAINHAKDAKVPIIVAVNKIDKPEANPDRVKTQLSERGLVPEDWGGDTQFVSISALQKIGLDELLDAILLQAEVLELTAVYDCRAEGKVIESRIDHGRGIVATIIVERGTLRTGDPYVAGVYSGRVRAIFNDRGEKMEEATPSMPVEILGLEGMPNAGDPFQVTESERMARQISDKRQELKRFENSRNVKKVTLDNLYDTINEGELLELKVIIKGDVQGSVEALKQSLEKLSTSDIRLNVIHASAGAINDSDVMLAAADSNAIIIGFNVRPTPQAKVLADQEKVDIRKYNVIYKAVEEIELAMEGMLKPDVKEETIGTVEVRDVIKVPKVGSIAGSYVLQGLVKRNSLVHVIREGIVVYSGKLASLRRFKDDVKEVTSGYECGICIENYDAVKVGDQLEVIELVEVARKLKDSEKSGTEKGKTE